MLGRREHEARARVPLPLSSRGHRNLASLISVQTPATQTKRLPACKRSTTDNLKEVIFPIVRNSDVLPRAQLLPFSLKISNTELYLFADDRLCMRVSQNLLLMYCERQT